MTYRDWGCNPLAEECESCLNAICNAYDEEFRKNRRNAKIPGGFDEACQDAGEPDCDRCDPEKIPDCSGCEIILSVCKSCSEHKTCEFRITGDH